MNILIITSRPFPKESALSNRILAFAKGFSALGHRCEIFAVGPPEIGGSLRSSFVQESIEGVEYFSIKKISADSLLRKYFWYFRSFLIIKDLLTKKFRKIKIDVIFTFLIPSIYLVQIINFAKSRRIKLIHERNEYPFLGVNSLIRKIDYFIYRKFLLSYFTGLIVITKELERYFKEQIKYPHKTLIVPIIVEPDRFLNLPDKNINEEYLCYSGHLWGDKDGVNILLDSFALIHQKFPDIKLYLIGKLVCSEELVNLILRLESLKILEKVVLTGEKTREEIPYYLNNAKVLVLARPDNIQAKAGFPTKLGEYLATGNPVLTTRVGDIPQYLTNSVNAYLSDPNSVADFAKQLAYIINNYNSAINVGKNGEKLAHHVFNNVFQAGRIIQFISEL